MEKFLYNGVDIFDPFKNNEQINIFIEAFTKVYGDKYRNIIEERLKNAKFFFLGRNYKKIAQKYASLLNQEIHSIHKNVLSPSLQHFKTIEITEKYNKKINALKEIDLKSKKIKEKYFNTIMSLLAKHINSIRKANHLNEICEENLLIYCPIFFEILNMDDEKFFNNIMYLSDKKKNEYVRLFNILGYKENKFDDYFKNLGLFKQIFDKNIAKQVIYINSLLKNELLEEDFCSLKFINKFNSLNMHDVSKGYLNLGLNFIQGENNATSAFVVNCLSNDEGFISLCLCQNALFVKLDTLVHEMGHIIDSTLVDFNNNGFLYKSGFELHNIFFDIKILPLNFNSVINPNEAKLFNEIVNQFFCMQVSEEIKKSDNSLIFEANKDRKNIYEFGLEIFENFLKKHQKKLIEIKMTKDKLESAYNYFGKQNLKKLYRLADNYIKNRNELNNFNIKYSKNVDNEIEYLNFKALKKLKKVEKNIEKHIAKSLDKDINTY